MIWGIVATTWPRPKVFARKLALSRDAGTGGGRRGSRPRCPLPGGAKGAKVPFQFKGLPWRNSELSEMLGHYYFTNLLQKTQEMQ